MFGSIALDIVIGLVFIYLLYSLFATVLSEIIATKLGIRARNLKEAIDRMLNDEKKINKWGRFIDSLHILKDSKNNVITEFYNHPEIKYLGSSGLFKNPSSFQSVSFSKTLINLLSDDQPITRELLDAKLASPQTKIVSIKGTLQSSPTLIDLDPETSKYLRILWADSNGDIAKFKFFLEGWFDRTMEQATEWYKRKIQVILFVLGFFIAWFFNADTFTIISKLSVDKDARDKMVSMANTYIQNHPRPSEIIKPRLVSNPSLDSTSPLDNAKKPNNSSEASNTFNTNPVTVTKTVITSDSAYIKKMDSLLAIKDKLQADINNANSLLGLGAWLPDSLVVKKQSFYKVKRPNKKDSIQRYVLYSSFYDFTFEKNSCEIKFDKEKKTAVIYFSTGEKFCHLFVLLRHHLFGFLITAIAISLGAPFWFDLLNKLMRLRTSTKQTTDSTTNKQDGVTLDQRVG